MRRGADCRITCRITGACGAPERTPDGDPSVAYEALVSRIAAQLLRPDRPRTHASAALLAERLVTDVACFVLDWVEPS